MDGLWLIRSRPRGGKVFWTALLLVIIFFHLFVFYPAPLGDSSLSGKGPPRELTGTDTLFLKPGPRWPVGLPLPPASGGLVASESRVPSAGGPRPGFADRQDDRDEMVRGIMDYGLADAEVLRVMALVPRHKFVPYWLSGRAYDDSPLPIGYGQTISQPYIVAEMTRLLQLSSASRILEIGTGSGYQTAVLAEFTPHVFSVEIVPELADQARERLRHLGYADVQVRSGDGWHGWPEHGPFDGIIVTCSAGQIPPPLIRQLAPGGRMVIPVGPPFSTQWLMLVTKDASGTVSTQSLMAVAFVPFIHDDADGE